MLLVVYPINHKIKKYKFILMESDLNYLKNFRKEYSQITVDFGKYATPK